MNAMKPRNPTIAFSANTRELDEFRTLRQSQTRRMEEIKKGVLHIQDEFGFIVRIEGTFRNGHRTEQIEIRETYGHSIYIEIPSETRRSRGPTGEEKNILFQAGENGKIFARCEEKWSLVDKVQDALTQVRDFIRTCAHAQEYAAEEVA